VIRVRKTVRALHLYAGLALSALLFVLALTGSALVYKEAYWSWVYPELRGEEAVESSPADMERAIEVARERFGAELLSVKMPQELLPAYHLYLADGEALLSTQDFSVIDRWRPGERLMPLLFDLHAHLMAGERGEQVGGVIGLLGALMVASGLYLWWPTRRRFSVRNVLPRGWARGWLIIWHRDLGTLSAPLLLILLLTGSGMVFYEQAGVLLNGLFGDPPLAAPAAPSAGSAEIAPVDAALLTRVDALLPEARLVFYYPPTPTNATHGFRLQRTCELHPNGRSYLYLGPTGDVLERTDACLLPPGQQALHAVYPLHAGKVDSSVYKLLTFLGGLALAAISLSGVLAYAGKLRTEWRRGRRARAMPRQHPAAPAASG
jgi:uncharacterized iron-regulated membrane protein